MLKMLVEATFVEDSVKNIATACSVHCSRLKRLCNYFRACFRTEEINRQSIIATRSSRASNAANDSDFLALSLKPVYSVGRTLLTGVNLVSGKYFFYAVSHFCAQPNYPKLHFFREEKHLFYEKSMGASLSGVT